MIATHLYIFPGIDDGQTRCASFHNIMNSGVSTWAPEF
jgi:hypothetical protein